MLKLEIIILIKLFFLQSSLSVEVESNNLLKIQHKQFSFATGIKVRNLNVRDLLDSHFTEVKVH